MGKSSEEAFNDFELKQGWQLLGFIFFINITFLLKVYCLPICV